MTVIFYFLSAGFNRLIKIIRLSFKLILPSIVRHITTTTKSNITRSGRLVLLVTMQTKNYIFSPHSSVKVRRAIFPATSTCVLSGSIGPPPVIEIKYTITDAKIVYGSFGLLFTDVSKYNKFEKLLHVEKTSNQVEGGRSWKKV